MVRDSNSGRSGAGGYASSFSVGAGVLCGWGLNNRGMRPWLKMSRAIPLLHLYAFMVWMGTSVPFPFPLDLPTLKVACAVHAGLLDELQHMIRLNPKPDVF